MIVITGVVVFTGVIMSLVLLLLLVRYWVIGSGQIDIAFKHSRRQKLQVQAGLSLHETLSNAGLKLPNACGGKGTCGTCKIIVNSGGGVTSPIEESIISAKEIKQKTRLACQLKVKQNLTITLPEELDLVKEIQCKVISNNQIASFIKELVIEIPKQIPFDFHAGDYVQIKCPAYQMSYREIEILPEYIERWQSEKLLDLEVSNVEITSRAYSLANYPGEGNIMKFNIRLATPPKEQPQVSPGIVSSYIFGLKAGDFIQVAGPYGQMHVKKNQQKLIPSEMILIGGGVGMAPLRSIIFDQLVNQHNSNKMSYWYGARSLCEVFYTNEFDSLAKNHSNFNWTLALSNPQSEDNWQGASGFVHQVCFEQYLANHLAPEDIEYYLCGPPPMIEACLIMLDELGVDQENISVDQFG